MLLIGVCQGYVNISIPFVLGVFHHNEQIVNEKTNAVYFPESMLHYKLPKLR